MIKTTYQTPEIRDANDNIIQQGAFGKNTALSNSTNDGWIDYVVNNLEALHDTIGDSAAHLDGNGHVVEPANLAIGDEDGNRLKTSYLKLSGGTVAGTLNVQQNLKIQDNQENVFGGMYVPSSSATEQFISIYGGESVSADGARLYLYPQNDGHFHLQAKSADGANTYVLKNTDNGGLFWRGYELAWKKDYLPLAGGTMTGGITLASVSPWIATDSSSKYLRLMNVDYSGGASLYLYGSNRAEQGRFAIHAFDGTNRKTLTGYADGTLTWGSDAIALAKNYLRLDGGTMTGWLSANASEFRIRNSKAGHDGMVSLVGGEGTSTGASLYIYGVSHSSQGGRFNLSATDGTNTKSLIGRPDGTLTWNNNDLNPQRETVVQTSSDVAVASGSAGTELLSFELTKGTWFVNYIGNFSANANGYRHLAITSTSDGGAYNRFCWVRQGNAGNIASSMLSGSSILRVGSTSTFYLRAYQNSGSSLNVSAGVQLFRLSTVS